MKKMLLICSVAFGLGGCLAGGPVDLSGNGDVSAEEVRQRRYRVRPLDMEDYQIERRRRRDAIQDYGDMRMREGEAINKAYENRSRQTIIIK